MRKMETFKGLEVWLFERVCFLGGVIFLRFRIRVSDDVVLKTCINTMFLYGSNNIKIKQIKF